MAGAHLKVNSDKSFNSRWGRSEVESCSAMVDFILGRSYLARSVHNVFGLSQMASKLSEMENRLYFAVQLDITDKLKSAPQYIFF